MGAVPSPAESETAACEHAADVSVTVKVTARGAPPEVGTTVREADAGPLVTTVVLPPPIGFRFMLGLVVNVVGMYTPHGSDVGVGDMYRVPVHPAAPYGLVEDRKSTRLNSSHSSISY